MNTNFVAHFEQHANAGRFECLSSINQPIDAHLYNDFGVDINTVCDGSL
jgi:hypothetical protein